MRHLVAASIVGWGLLLVTPAHATRKFLPYYVGWADAVGWPDTYVPTADPDPHGFDARYADVVKARRVAVALSLAHPNTYPPMLIFEDSTGQPLWFEVYRDGHLVRRWEAP